jgi:hypothetical protein
MLKGVGSAQASASPTLGAGRVCLVDETEDDQSRPSDPKDVNDETSPLKSVVVRWSLASS